MSVPGRQLLVALLVVVAAGVRPSSQAPPSVTSPIQQFGAAIGDDYFLATFAQLEEYWRRLDLESDRLELVSIGSTEEGRPQPMAIVSAPENLAALERYREISRRLALAEGLTDQAARALAQEGKAIVWIDGGLHADEVLGAQQLIELTYELASRSDPETLRVLRDVIVLVAHANPDGHALVADWYMREPDPRRRTLEGVPRPYQKYVGHDNNRDFYLVSQAETININRVLYREWFPQIVYDHHQAGPPGTVMFAPPFRGPFNYVFDPLIPTSLELIGGAMHARFAAEGKPGVTMRGGANYSTWWNGGLRTTAYFHNQIGLLTETIGSPTPIEIPHVPERQIPGIDLPLPIRPGPWRFRQSVEYSMTANRAVLDTASRYRDTLLYNAYRMAKNAIERGSTDSWLVSPRNLTSGTDPRAPRAYVLPSSQPDFLTATKFVASLLKAGVVVHRATAPFGAGGKIYPSGSYVVKTAQAFRPHVLDMFEPQEHPDDVPSPGAPPRPPYDIAGWTLAFQMGVKFDRLLDTFEAPLETVAVAAPPRGTVAGAKDPAGYLVSHHQNDAFILVNRLLGRGADVFWPRDRRTPSGDGTGSIYVGAAGVTRATLEDAAAELGLSIVGVSAPPAGGAYRLRPVRVGLWDRYGGASTSGWIRWILERFEFPFDRVHAPALDEGRLSDRYDVLIFPDEAVPAAAVPTRASPEQVPAEYRHAAGAITWKRTVPQLRQFLEDGGTVVAIGGATAMAESLGVRVSNALTTTGADGSPRPLAREDFYVPGSVLRVTVDNTRPLAYGFEREVDVFFDDSPVFTIPESAAPATRPVAWFAHAAPLRSGWARGQHHLAGGVAAVEAQVGRGRVVLFGPEITFRAQPHGTFKFLFNAIHHAEAQVVPEIAGARR